MTLFIYETCHHEVLAALLHLASQDFDRIVLCLPASSYAHLCAEEAPGQWPRVSFLVQPPHQPNRVFIRHVLHAARRERCTHLHISTLDHNQLYFTTLLMALRLHHQAHLTYTIHDYKAYTTTPGAGLKARSERLAKKLLHRIVHNHCILGTAVNAAFLARFGYPAVSLPPALFKAAHPVPHTPGALRIVVPGGVSPTRRDYDSIWSLCHQHLASPDPAFRLHLTLLGNAGTSQGQHIVARFGTLAGPFFEVVTFNTYVPQAAYIQHFTGAHFIWNPYAMDSDGVPLYGAGKSAGFLGDVIRYGKSFLAQAGPLPEALEAGSLTYFNTNDLYNKLQGLMADPAVFNTLQAAPAVHYPHYNIANYLPAFRKLMRQPSLPDTGIRLRFGPRRPA